MRLSIPRTRSRLRRPISASMQQILLPSIANAAERLAVVVVLPTPALPDVIVITRAAIQIPRLNAYSVVQASATIFPSRTEAISGLGFRRLSSGDTVI